MSMTDATTVPGGRLVLEAIRDGELPPPAAAVTLDLDLDGVDDGRTVFGFHPAARFDNGQHAVHGGILAAVADFAVTTAVLTTLAAGDTVVTTNLNVTYVRPVLPTSDALRCEGRVVHRGRRLVHAEATISDLDGRLYATATATCQVSVKDQRTNDC